MLRVANAEASRVTQAELRLAHTPELWLFCVCHGPVPFKPSPPQVGHHA